MFLRNHDELTLEMVTDEERDYMWRVYANDPTARINLGIRRRLAPLLANSRRKIELLNILLFSMPGTPVIYYGDEIGMGDNVYLGDRNGVRTPMQWSADRNAGFSRANPQQLLLPIIIDPGVQLRSDQRREPAEESVFAALVDAPRHRDAQELQGVLARHARVPLPGEREGARLPAAARRRDGARGRESLALLAGRGARSLALRRLRADGGVRAELFPARSKMRPTSSRSGRTRISGLCSGRSQRPPRERPNARCRRSAFSRISRRCSMAISAS